MSDSTVGSLMGAGIAGVVGLSAMKMVSDTAGQRTQRGGSGKTLGTLPMPQGIKGKQEEEKFLDVWYRLSSENYNKYHSLHGGNRKEMIVAIYDEEPARYKKIRTRYDNAR